MANSILNTLNFIEQTSFMTTLCVPRNDINHFRFMD